MFPKKEKSHQIEMIRGAERVIPNLVTRLTCATAAAWQVDGVPNHCGFTRFPFGEPTNKLTQMGMCAKKADWPNESKGSESSLSYRPSIVQRVG
ncbi:MAG: hypothetical protein MI861_09725 [Pirellulales bacterium]|nr:hypothetical protein [Pirellulales bacterium]